MKSFTIIVSSILIMTLFTQCGSAQQFDKKAPFTINKAYFQEWMGGRGSTGTTITLELTEPLSDKIIIDSLFFKNKTTPLSISNYKTKHTVTGNFISTRAVNRDLIMHADSQKEMANKVPETSSLFPFELSDNECVISYFIKDKKHYYKVTGLKKEKTVYYP